MKGQVHPSRPTRLSPADRFWPKVDKAGPGGCWLWTAGLSPDGYGRFKVGKRSLQAHRFAFELLVGPIPPGLMLDHVRARGCTNRNCVNPAHLEPVTNRVNTLRGDTFQGINARKTHCKYGHEFTEKNTYRRSQRRSNGKTYRGRVCKTCVRAASKRYRARQKAAA